MYNGVNRIPIYGTRKYMIKDLKPKPKTKPNKTPPVSTAVYEPLLMPDDGFDYGDPQILVIDVTKKNPFGRSKFNARKVKAYGYTFDSKNEYLRYVQLLKMQVNTGAISGLRRASKMEDRILLVPAGIDAAGRKRPPTYYEPDFIYVDTTTGETIQEDAKGKETVEFKLKMKVLGYLRPDIKIKLSKISDKKKSKK